MGGAEKALFRALKTRQDTPKYGLIYHASMVGQAAPKNKGKVSRMLAAKAALAIRYDALAEGDAEGSVEFAIEARTQLEKRARELELRKAKVGGGGFKGGKGDKYKHKSEVVSYDQAKDQTIKRKKEPVEETTPAKKVKKEVKEEPSTTESMDVTTEETPTKSKKEKKKKKKAKKEAAEEEEE